MSNARILAIVGAIVAVVLIGVAGFVLAPANRDPNTFVVATIAPTILGFLTLLGVTRANEQLNGAMDKHLANAKDIGVSAAANATELAREAVHDAAVVAVDQVMQEAMAQARASKVEGAGQAHTSTTSPTVEA